MGGRVKEKASREDIMGRRKITKKRYVMDEHAPHSEAGKAYGKFKKSGGHTFWIDTLGQELGPLERIGHDRDILGLPGDPSGKGGFRVMRNKRGHVTAVDAIQGDGRINAGFKWHVCCDSSDSDNSDASSDASFDFHF